MSYHLFFLIFITLAGYSTALKCYDCLEMDEPPLPKSDVPKGFCNLYDESLLTDCPNSEVCTVTDTRLGAVSGPIHGCGTTKDECTKLDGTVDENGFTKTCTSCDTDKCNGRPELGMLRCFECSIPPPSGKGKSAILRPCNNFTDQEVSLCPPTSHVCVSMEIKDVDGVGYVYGCGTTEEECVSADGVTLSNGAEYSCESCTTNKCNSGVSGLTALSLFNMVVLTFATKFGIVLLNF